MSQHCSPIMKGPAGVSRKALALAIVFLVAIAGVASAETVAETSNFTTDTNKIPVSASTKFFLPIWTDGDATRTAHHELLHATGFAAGYSKFSVHVDGDRNFRESASATGTIFATLTPANQGTHIDPGAGTVNGHDQSTSVMGPKRVTGQRMGPQEKSVLNAAVDWSSKNINIVVSYKGTWSTEQKKHIENAVSSAKTLFGSNGSGHKFTWTVEMAEAFVPPALQALSSSKISDLAAQIDEGGGSQRVLAASEVLSRGVSAVPELRAAGARPMSGLSPRRIDVLYSILSGQPEGRYRTNGFGLHVEPGTTREEIAALGERHGFVVPSDQSIETSNSPCCYVVLREGRDLWEVIASLLSREAKVATVNLNYIEQ
ncbi:MULTISPECIES: hypothetical protein [unclassified Bradyrhizobium]|uniref:hypothetical protein n=1 Tax=unclassified Bradyrhizobium TaxID=2631580 RepID=UPI0028E33985|nr:MULTISPECIES: hypothetical protein [unclassified Bradyrhizobium]